MKMIFIVLAQSLCSKAVTLDCVGIDLTQFSSSRMDNYIQLSPTSDMDLTHVSICIWVK